MNRLRATMCFVLALATAETAVGDWLGWTYVNTNTFRIQASRDNDCPWSIVCDSKGDAHMVWEDFRGANLETYYRKRQANGTWGGETDVSAEIGGQGEAYGHPTITVVEAPADTKLYVAYVDERILPDSVREVRGNTFGGEHWGDQSYFISDSGGHILPGGTPFWSLNMVVTPALEKFVFWEYLTTNSYGRTLYFNSSFGEWDPENESVAFSGNDTLHQTKHPNACVSTDTTVHLVYSDLRPDRAWEVFYLDKRPTDSNFGQYPGTLVSSSLDPITVHAEYPSCAYSYYNGVGYIHVVWSLNPPGQIQYRRLNLNTNSWSGINQISPPGDQATRPSLAVDNAGNVHVVWQVGDQPNVYITKYRVYDFATGRWGPTSIVPAPPGVQKWGLPVLACDKFNDLHLLMTGYLQGANSEDVFYIQNDYEDPAPATGLGQSFGNHFVTIYWQHSVSHDRKYYEIWRSHKNEAIKLNQTDDSTYVDTQIPEYDQMGHNYVYYWLITRDDGGKASIPSDSLLVFIPPNLDPRRYPGVDGVPLAFVLLPNSPNPFNATTEIRYALPIDCEVKLTIYDIAGRRVRELVDNHQNAGYKSAIWDGRDSYGNSVASGVYIYRLDAAGEVFTKRMLMIK